MDIRLPAWIKYKETYPFVDDKKYRYMIFDNNERSYRGGFKQEGYDPSRNSIKPVVINPYKERPTRK